MLLLNEMISEMGLIGPQNSKSQVATLIVKCEVIIVIVKGSISNCNAHDVLSHKGQLHQSQFYGGMTQTNLWYQLINHNVSRQEIDKKPTAFLFNLCKQKNSQTSERNLHWIVAKENFQSVNQFPGLSRFLDPEDLI